MENDRKNIASTLEIARSVPPVAGCRVSAAIIEKGQILSVGFGQLKSHPFQKRFGGENKQYLHAEIAAIRQITKKQYFDLSRCTLYVARAKWTNPKKELMTQGLAKPCTSCFNCITAFCIGRVVYTLNEEGYSEL